MQRSGPLNPMSAKRRAQLLAAGLANPHTTLIGHGPALHRTTPTRPRPVADTGPTPEVVAVVIARDEGRCFRCGVVIRGERGRDWSIQHRRGRGTGGTSLPDTNQPPNLILLDGSGTTGCHGWVEHNRTAALAAGWAVPRLGKRSNPLLAPVTHHRYGRVWLTADGGWTREQPAVTR